MDIPYKHFSHIQDRRRWETPVCSVKCISRQPPPNLLQYIYRRERQHIPFPNSHHHQTPFSTNPQNLHPSSPTFNLLSPFPKTSVPQKHPTVLPLHSKTAQLPPRRPTQKIPRNRCANLKHARNEQVTVVLVRWCPRPPNARNTGYARNSVLRSTKVGGRGCRFGLGAYDVGLFGAASR
ncbi:hypothetical protein M501DRAFT_174037 [Patellaria atrata CBS 101060]|uniref:Uncharacterized protein n=1 Tax=Patellaria atrata CBS 101060 TaxID=1346257 RepID=A0A9P4S950_9PEZI|nr:hypothetical protein M501DRAFT_174037 [Patellaria atrata CBS 101060]